jgi:hypothetical protein
MSDTPAQDAPKPAKIDIRKEIAHAEWKDDPVVGFEHKSSLAIARRVLTIFGGCTPSVPPLSDNTSAFRRPGSSPEAGSPS